MHPLRLLAEIKKCLEPDSIIAADGGATQVWTSMAMEVNPVTKRTPLVIEGLRVGCALFGTRADSFHGGTFPVATKA